MSSEGKIPDSNWQEFTIFLGVINVSPGPNNLQLKKSYYNYDAHSDHHDGGGDDNNHDNEVFGAQACGYCQ